MNNYKTSLTGLGALMIALGDIFHSWPNPNWSMDMPLIVNCIIGLLAKDYNVTGGTVGQTAEAISRTNGK